MKISKQSYWEKLYLKDFSIAEHKWFCKNFERSEQHKILKKILKKSNKSIFEIGCAPGRMLYYFNKNFGYVPGGVEYTLSGYIKTRKLFEFMNWDKNHLLNKDFLNEEFISSNSGKYDLTYSAGFIEHFKNPMDIMKKQLKITKKKGYMIIVVPNLTVYMRLLQPIFDKSVLPQHNTYIMQYENFRQEIFKFQKNNRIDIKFLNLAESINLGQLAFKNYVFMKIFNSIQFILDYTIKPVLPNNKITSSTILLIVKKL